MPVLALTSAPSELDALDETLASDELSIASEMSHGLDLFRESSWLLVLLDEAFAGDVTLGLLRRLADEGAAPVYLLARSPSPRLVVDAMQQGARDVLPFPPSPSRVAELLAGARLSVDEPANSAQQSVADHFVGRCPAVLEAFKAVARAAPTRMPVLIRGASGTGKELVARAIHERSPRMDGPFVAVNCAAIAEGIPESELFGHEKGAFTGADRKHIGLFEEASGGTVFLDEIGDLSLRLQAKILRVLQEDRIRRVGGEKEIDVDVRVISATHRHLEREVAAGAFRQDLYYRLSGMPILLPPLRTRGDDVRLLAEHFLARFSAEHGKNPAPMLSPEVAEALAMHPWPGNVRQLMQVIERVIVWCDGPVVTLDDLPADILDPSLGIQLESDEADILVSLEDIEKRHILRVVEAMGGRRQRAATVLKIHRNTLRDKLKEYEDARK